MKIGVLKETYPGEQRVALVPSVVPSLIKGGMEVIIESRAGEQAGYPDSAYVEKGGKIADSREQVFQMVDCILQVRLLGANLHEGKADLPGFRKGQMLVGIAEALSHPQSVQDLAAREVTSFALELMPRITRAQSMDILSSMGTVAGYKAVVMAANTLPKMFPMLMTAAGTV
ncbi:MAG: NAD(P)(+) transhydrogenase (Re/Si-specific) subunit alpha, partial [Nitrospirota bacterium]|nr:NAD(P)(+) transhydrogenase (Re/Si-specific) subunit alpha [Nitrospirota bacterium]